MLVVIRLLLLLIPVPLLILRHFIRKRQYLLDVRPNYICRYETIGRHTFGFKKMGFDHSTNKQATFDQYYLVECVYGRLAHAGNDVTNEAHLLSHFNHAALCTPIVPIHVDNTVNNDQTVPSILQCRNNQRSATP
jgi:hypothetical protein